MKNTLKKILASATAIATVGTMAPAFASCNKNEYKDMDVTEQLGKDITADSDKEAITYTFQQTDTSNYQDTQAVMVDLHVHNKEETADNVILSTTCTSDGKVSVRFDTQRFILKYLAKYYETESNSESNVIPSTYRFELINSKNKTKYISSQYSLTITPAEYAVTFHALSQYITFPDTITLKVYQALNTTYTIDERYALIDRHIMRYDGKDLIGETGVVFENGVIQIPAEYVTGPIVISADAQYNVCDIHAYTKNVQSISLPEKGYVQKGETIEGTYTLAEGYEIKQSAVYIGETKLTGGYEIADGKIRIDGKFVQDEVSIVILADKINYSVTAVGNGHVSFNIAKSIPYKEKLTGTYTLDTGYVIKQSAVYVGDTKLGTDAYTISGGNIEVKADYIVDDVWIGIETTKDEYSVTGEGENVTFSLPEKIAYQTELTGTYTIATGYKFTKAQVYVNDTEITTGFTIADGSIKVEAAQITGKVKIVITTEKQEYTVSTYKDDGVKSVTLASTVKYKEAISGSYELETGYDLATTAVYVGETKLEDGYTIEDGSITIEAGKATDNVTVVLLTEAQTYSVITSGEHVTFTGVPKTIQYHNAITGTYTIDTGYKFAGAEVWVNEIKILDGYTIKDGSISIDADRVEGPVKIIILTEKQDYTVKGEGTNVTYSLPESIKYQTELNGTYTLTEGYEVTAKSVTVGGTVLTDGFTIADGKIQVTAAKVTGNVVISITATKKKETVAKYFDDHVKSTDLPTQVEYKTEINGTYTIDDGYSIKTKAVYVGETKLADGYSIENGKIHVNADKVTDYVTVVILTDKNVYSVVSTGEHVTFSGLPESIQHQEKDITGTYTVAAEYEEDPTDTYVTVNGTKVTGATVSSGTINIPANLVTGNVVIHVGTKEKLKKYDVTATGDTYITFASSLPQAVEGKKYELSYKAKYGSLNTLTITMGGTTLVENTHYTIDRDKSLITINEGVINNSLNIVAVGKATEYSFTYDFDDRIYVVSYTQPIVYGTDFQCVIGLYMEAGTVTGWGCEVGGDPEFTKYLEYDSATKTFTLPGQYVQGNIKIWASLA